MSRWVLSLVSSSTLDGHMDAASAEVEAQIIDAKELATYEMTPVAMICEMIAALAVYWVLDKRLPGDGLLWWLLARQALATTRLAHGVACMRGHLTPGPRARQTFAVLATADGLLWGMLGWHFTPLFQLDVAVVSICVLIGVASMGAQMLYVTLPGAMGFITPILVPNAFFAYGRHDDLGTFCLLAVLGYFVMMLGEVHRSHARTTNMLRLRFESEQLSQAKTEALGQAKLLAETKSRFLATMSHEMRTPLHGVLGLIRLARHASQPELCARHLTLAQSTGEHLLSVINDVLDFSKLEAEGLAVNRRPFALEEMLKELADTSRVLSTEKGLSLDVSIDVAPEEHVLGDPTRLRQVLHNLIGNAIKFTPRGTVGLHAWRDAASGDVVVEVRDTGIGIPAHEISRVFEAFHQADSSFERKFGGTGLGLTISRELCQAMGGHLSCTSEPGRGSVFTCTLPLPAVAQPAPQPTAVRRATNLPGSSFAYDLSVLDAPHVLVVEDNPVNALVAQAELQRLGVRATVVNSGPDAIARVRDDDEIDLILMDCEMPGMDGIETTRRIRAHEREQGRPAVSIVALTANGADMYVQHCEPAGMNGHLLKPFRSKDLADMLSRHMRIGVSA